MRHFLRLVARAKREELELVVHDEFAQLRNVVARCAAVKNALAPQAELRRRVLSCCCERRKKKEKQLTSQTASYFSALVRGPASVCVQLKIEMIRLIRKKGWQSGALTSKLY